jgi:hypothetical protein
MLILFIKIDVQNLCSAVWANIKLFFDDVTICVYLYRIIYL